MKEGENMKFILKDGTEYGLENMEYHESYVEDSTTSGYFFHMTVDDAPKALLETIKTSLTDDNISDITIVMDNDKTLNFSFTKLNEIGLQVIPNGIVLCVILT